MPELRLRPINLTVSSESRKTNDLWERATLLEPPVVSGCAMCVIIASWRAWIGYRLNQNGKHRPSSMNTIAMVCLAALTAVNAFAAAAEPPSVRMIFDTDIQGDADDVGTVAVLHALADSGEAEILAMGVSSKNPWSPLCLSALNTYFGRGDIPLGVPMPNSQSTRRAFLGTSAAALAGASLLRPSVAQESTASSEKPRAKVERLGIASIGMRYQGTVITEKARLFGDIVAIADVDRHVREQARASWMPSSTTWATSSTASRCVDKRSRTSRASTAAPAPVIWQIYRCVWGAH